VEVRQERVAKNESLFRDVNERIKEVNRDLLADERSDYLCECGSRDCTLPISLTLVEYERVRRVPTHFAIVPGHEVTDVERVVSQTEHYAIVEKDAPTAARIAVERDPRA
jgi:hypothetical protein